MTTHSVTNSYTASVPVFTQMLTSLQAVLTKAEAYAVLKKIDPSVLLQSRLYPDMFSLLRQVQIAGDFAKGTCARLAQVDVPSYEDTETTFAELQARLTKALAFIQSLPEAAFTHSDERQIVLRPGTPKERTLTGQNYLLHYGIPQFFFHMTTAYAILRHNGLEVGKGDFMGSY